MSTLNLTLPTCWQELSDVQLRFVFSLLAGDYSLAQLKAMCLIKWADLTVIRREGQVFIIKHKKEYYPITAQQITEASASLKFLGDLPKYPVRLSQIDGHTAIRADLQELPFGDYISLDNLYQGYLQTQKPEILQEMAKILYQSQTIKLNRVEGLSVFYWFAGAKQMFALMFTHFFKSASTGDEYHAPSFQQLQDSMNAQIRALTNGDITKEKAVLEMDTWRALTELNAKAKDYEDIKKSTKS